MPPACAKRHSVARLARLAAAALALAASHAALAGITVQSWGTTRAGQPVERVTLSNARGMRISIIDYGATLTEIRVRGKDGKAANVMLGLPSLAAYEATQRRHGAVIGRYAGRIGNARFTLDGKVVALAPNAKGVSLHSDPDGFDKRVWRRRDVADADSIAAVYSLVSPDGDQGHPGRLEVSVTYRLLRRRDELRIEYAATADRPAVLNLTNHGFFNLAGAGSAGLATHAFQVNADRYALTDAVKVPTGVLAPVAGTRFDLRRKAGVMDRIEDGYDHGLVFAKEEGALALVATIDESGSGRRMQVWTTEPAVVFNTGNGFDGSEVGSEGVAYQKHAGFAFETQHLSDSPNRPEFPSTVVKPEKPYESVTIYRFSTLAPQR
jgi:aldose 1-epimerase